MPDQLKTHYCPACRMTFRVAEPPRSTVRSSRCSHVRKGGKTCGQRMWDIDRDNLAVVGINPADLPEGVA